MSRSEILSNFSENFLKNVNVISGEKYVHFLISKTIEFCELQTMIMNLIEEFNIFIPFFLSSILSSFCEMASII